MGGSHRAVMQPHAYLSKSYRHVQARLGGRSRCNLDIVTTPRRILPWKVIITKAACISCEQLHLAPRTMASYWAVALVGNSGVPRRH